MLEQLVLSGFAGGVAAQDLSLSVNGARVLDTDTGRFLSPDPLLHVLNQVTYAVGNPIFFEDRNGLKEGAISTGASPGATAITSTALAFAAGIALKASVVALNLAPAGAAIGPAGLFVVATAIVLAVTTYVAIDAINDYVDSTQAEINSSSSDEGAQTKQIELKAEGDRQSLLDIRGQTSDPHLEIDVAVPSGFAVAVCAPIAPLVAQHGRSWFILVGICALATLLAAARSQRGAPVG